MSDLSWSKWTADDIKNIVPKLLESNRAALEKVKCIAPKERTFKNTVLGMEYAAYGSVDAINALEALKKISTDKSVRDEATGAVNRIRKELLEINYDPELYKALLEYGDRKEELVGRDKKLFEESIRTFRRMGFGLPEEKRLAVKENLGRRIELQNGFSKNLNEYRDSVNLTREELKGMDEAYIGGLRKNEDGTYSVGLDYPEYVPFMGHAENALKRKELMDKNFKKGGLENLRLLKEVLKLREENAKILGYKNHVNFETEVLMAKNEKTVSDFLSELGEKLRPAVEKELSELTELKRKMTGDAGAELEYFDVNYYMEKLRTEKFNINSEKLREYFPLYKVKQGIFGIYSKLFSIKIEQIKKDISWHEEAEFFAVTDLEGNPVAEFALDIFPREGKYTHACAMDIVPGREENGSYKSPFAVLLMNFRKPSGSTPSLLSHSEVQTFFHELGHLMHFCLGRAKYISQNPFGVAWDFVEAPSQMLEYWVWEKEPLKLLSEHYENKQPIPDDMLNALVVSKDYMMGYLTMRQIIFALYDLYLHSGFPRNELEITGKYNELFRKHVGINLPEDNIFAAGFGHLMGYDAKYYAYTWSRVFAADMFIRFENEGILEEKTGMDYRRSVLEPGAEKEEMQLLRDFLGREPDNRAFLKELGVK